MIKARRNPDHIIFIGYAAIACLVVLVLHACTGCTPKNNAAFAADIAMCEQAPTCADAVLCRKAVAEKYGRPFSGRCEPLDGGK